MSNAQEKKICSVIDVKKKGIYEKLWLHYYNNVLFEKGIISETEYKYMKNKINNRKSTL